MSELRYYGFKIHVQNEDGTTKVKQFRRAVSDVDSTVEMLNNSLGDNVSVTAKKTQTDAEATAQARMLVSQQERQNRKTEQIVTQYTRLNSTIKQYGNNAEVVNAITRLGSNATEVQKQEVAELVQEYQRLRNAGDGTRGSFRNLRGVAQNFGWQLQDTVVQMQMGTDAMVVMSQQGSQMAAAFGPLGAIIGAGIAIAGAAIPTLIQQFGEVETSIEEVEEAQKNLNDVFDNGVVSIKGVSGQLKELYKADKQLAELTVVTAMYDAEMAMVGFRNEMEDSVGSTLDIVNDHADRVARLGKEFGSISSGVGRYGMTLEASIGASNAVLDEQAKTLGITRDQIIELGDSYRQFSDTGSIDALKQTLVDLKDSSSELTPEFGKFVAGFVEAAKKGELAKAQIEKLNDMMTNGIDSAIGAKKEVEDLAQKYNVMTAELAMTSREQAKYNFWLNDAEDLTHAQRMEVLQSIDTYYDQKKAIEATEQALKDEKAAREELKKVRADIDPAQAAMTETFDYIDRLEALKQFGLSEEEFQQASLQAWRDYYDKVGKLHEGGGDDIEKETATIMGNVTKLWEKLDTPITDVTQKQAESIGKLAEQTQVQLGVMSQAGNMFSTTIDTMVNGTQRVQEATKDMNDAQKAAFILMQSISAAEAIIQGLVLGSKLASMFANPALIAVGAGIGAAQAGAIMGTTFAGAFDDGGYIPSGQQGIVAEYGDELVNGRMVQGPARVVGREETARRQGNNGGQAVVKIYNAPGQTAQVSQNAMGETEVRIIAAQVFNERIDSGVAGVLSDERTKTNKAMKNNYQAPRKR